MNKQEKIELAKKLSAKYHKAKIGSNNLRDAWNEIEQECKKAGINPDLMLITPSVFEILTNNKAIDNYFFNVNQ